MKNTKIRKSLEIPKLEKRPSFVINMGKRVHNRKWQILEIVRKAGRITIPMIAWKLDDVDDRHKIHPAIANLVKRKYLNKEENEGGKYKYIYSLGPMAKRYLKDYECESFIGSPYDPGPNGERKEEVMKFKLKNKYKKG